MPQSPLDDLAARVAAAPPTSGGSRIVLIDGPAGAGKTTLACRLAGILHDAPVLHADDMYEGWGGLATLTPLLVGQVVKPLTSGAPATFARWDWHQGMRGEELTLAPAPVVLIEGVGVGQRDARSHASLLIWVEAPVDVRHERWLHREGADSEGHWRAWARGEREHFAADGTRGAADLIVDGGAVEWTGA
ncbi:uridine kinase [Demequina sp. NBRC 110055]|uniref:uridine kinase family protein n=1 Tax=Demequina sp. NBRC 110055 TaxID=1570344 RepID=UPI000A0513A7|nr:hypothetical protein [Demequina sp. NBRC 110055]